ncbi:MAG: hypothetical protein HYS81_04995 [Candidatus Aenigmatarchaeota archaeon]|nr:MAG: hypothetical protein HYS81_04995 [Candidatus Aenigmarchaeota archaeon]
MKGISPVIASIILVLIVLSLAGAYTVFTGRLSGTQTEAGQRSSQELVGALGTSFKIDGVEKQDAIVRNIGVQSIKKDSLAVSIDGTILNYSMPGDIAEGSTGRITVKGLWAGGRGEHVLRIAGPSFSDSVNIELDTADGAYQDLRFEEGSGTVVRDSSGNGRDGALIGSPNRTTGKFGSALRFTNTDGAPVDGVNMTIKLGTFDRFTVEAWANPSNITTNTHPAQARGWVVVGPSQASRLEFAMGWSNQTAPATSLAWAFYWGGAGWPSASANVSDARGTWHHLVYSYDNTTNPRSKYYYDGVLIATVNDPRVLTPSDNFWQVASGYGNNYQGLVDEVRIFDRAYSADELYVMTA